MKGVCCLPVKNSSGVDVLKPQQNLPAVVFHFEFPQLFSVPGVLIVMDTNKLLPFIIIQLYQIDTCRHEEASWMGRAPKECEQMSDPQSASRTSQYACGPAACGSGSPSRL